MTTTMAIVFFLQAALVSGTPLLFATLGEIITERAGNLNLGVRDDAMARSAALP